MREQKPHNPGGVYLWFKNKRVKEIREKNPDLEFKEAAALATKDYKEFSEK